MAATIRRLPRAPVVRLGFYYEAPVTMQQQFLQMVTILREQGASLTGDGYFFTPDNLSRGLQKFNPEQHEPLMLAEPDWLYGVLMKNVLNLTRSTQLEVVTAAPFNEYLQQHQHIIQIETEGYGIFSLFGKDEDAKKANQAGKKVYEKFAKLIALTHPRYACIVVETGDIIPVNALKHDYQYRPMLNNFYIDKACLTPPDMQRFIELYASDEKTYVEHMSSGVYLSKNAPFNPQHIDKASLKYDTLGKFLANRLISR